MRRSGWAIVLLGALAFLLSVGFAYGQSGIFDRPGGIPGHGGYSSLPEERVDLFTGNLTLAYRDVFLPGANGLNIEVWRVYNSKILYDRPEGQQNPTVQAYPKSMIGVGWTMHMGMVHNVTSDTPVIEFPDGRRETAFPPKAEYGYSSRIRITRNFLMFDKGVSHAIEPRLYFPNGVVWTFGNVATLPLASGSETVHMVTRIEDRLGNFINIEYDAADSLRSVSKITDSMGREVRFVKSYQGSDPAKLAEIRIRNHDDTHDVVYSYSVGSFANGFYKLLSFTPPLLPPATFDYNDGLSNNYELTRVTTSYGGALEFSYENHQFYFNAAPLNSKVVSQKRITFNAGEQAAFWDYTYPTYQGATSGTTTVEGPEYGLSATHYGFDGNSANRWRIGLQTAQATGDGSASSSTVWIYHEISDTNWLAAGVNMGKAKGPLVLTATEGRTGDSTLETSYSYLRPGVKRYGLPTKLSYFVNGSPTAKSVKELTYFFEAHSGFKDRYMLSFVANEKDATAGGFPLRETVTSYFEESGKWGALKQVKRWKTGATYLTWDYTYTALRPDYYSITVDGPAGSGVTSMSYQYGLEQSVTEPDYSRYTRHIYKYGYVLHEWNQRGGSRSYAYDDLGRTTEVRWRRAWQEPEDPPAPPPPPPPPFLTVNYDWRPGGENKVVITRGGNTVTRWWDGVGRDLGSTESGDGITLHSRKTLDAEGRIRRGTNGALEAEHEYVYAYDAAGRVTQVTDPVSETTTIAYSGHTRTVTDPESRSTAQVYNDLPGLPTRLTDAQGHHADYTYDEVGRLISVVFNGTRTQSYVYNPLDQMTSETHPETGTISYFYNTANRLAQKTWGGAVQNYSYNASGQLLIVGGADPVTYGYDDRGTVASVAGSSGWSRTGITYDDFGLVTAETITIPGLGSKSLAYAYDDSGNLTETTYPDGRKTLVSFNGLDRPETLRFGTGENPPGLITEASYGPNKQAAAVVFGNGTSLGSTFYDNGASHAVALTRGATPLYNAAYGYDGAGNITSISSTAPAPALNASFGYDSLNRLTSASYSTGAVGTYSYEYDAYGNMLTVRHDGGIVFSKTYKSSNQINDPGYQYDARGNLTAAPGSFYEWDAQNRLKVVRDGTGQYVAGYRYDERGLRLASFPPLPEIGVDGHPSGSNADITAGLQTPVSRTFTLRNAGAGVLHLGALTREGTDMDMFTVTQAPTTPVPPGQSTEFTIRFLPTSTGDKTATLSIASDDLDENPYLIHLRGFCEPTMRIVNCGNGQTYDFGTKAVGWSTTDTFYLDNPGTATLVLYEGWPVTIEESAGEWSFHLEGQSGGNEVPAGYTNSFTVRFAPLSEGPKSASVTIFSNDPDESPYTIYLAGTGIWGTEKVIDDDGELTLLSPNGGEALEAGSLRPITWGGGEQVRDVKLEYSTDNGTTYRTIVERFANVGRYPWRVPEELSGSCLVRVSDADGTATVPVLVRFEFNFRVSAAEGAPPDRPHFVLRAGVPDVSTQTFQVAEVAFAPDGLRGTENLLFNYALGEVRELESFLGRWHQARIIYDLGSYTGSVWVDDEPILSGVPLRTDLDVRRPAEISLDPGPEVSVKLWIDDLDVKFADRSVLGQDPEGVVFRPLFRDNFNRYESVLFPREGGWLPGRTKALEQLQGTEEGAEAMRAVETGQTGASCIDDRDYASSARSFKLEGTEEEPGTAGKRFSFPERIPYSISADNFSIVEAGEAVSLDRLERGGPDRAAGRDGKRQKREDEVTSDTARGLAADRRPAETARPKAHSIRPDVLKAAGDSEMLSGPPPSGTYYIYSFDGRLLAEYSILGQWIRDYIYFGGRLVAEYRATEAGPELFYYAADQINSTRIVTDDTGTVVYSAAHEPYGGIQRTWVGTYDPEIKFSGQQRDAWSELDYFGARYYDRTQYRFISVDPIIPALMALHDPQRWGLYGYCRCSPISYLDPDGMQAIEIMRYNYGTSATQGIYRIELGDKVLYGHTLEPARGVGKGPIPEGEYDAIPYWWSKKGYEVYWLQGVDGFKEILIHRGNKPRDTIGCILVGNKRNGGEILGSKNALDEILFEIKDFTADMIQGEISKGMDDLDLMSLFCSGRITVRIWSIRLPDGIVTYEVVVRQTQ